MTRKTKLLTGALTLAVGLGAAGLGVHAYAGMAERTRLPLAPLFTAADANGDGAVTKAELDTFVRDRIKGMDADGNGAISEDEFEDALAESRKAMAQDRFEQLDADGNGQLSPEEFRQAAGTPGTIRGRDGDRLADMLFYRLDANDDDALQPIELTGFAQRVFARADANADGRVTRDELRKLRRDRDDRRGGPHKAGFDGHWGGDCR
jgi:Ca2+-binding EF-hand superfamily protein